jgi:molybdopterin molybdotransferase
LIEAPGRILATDVTAWRDVPVRDVSSMDGFACRAADREGALTVIETIPAGYAPQLAVGPGQCSRIMTGALLPEGADCVVMFEDAAEENGTVTVNKVRKQTNVRLCGEDQHRGDRVLSAGTLITPAVMAVLSAEGCDPVTVTVSPTVGIIATGDELVEPRVQPADHQIRNSNSFQLHAQVKAVGCEARYFGICRDSPDETRRLFVEAASVCDVIIFSGGVSAGDFDFVEQVLGEQGVRILVNGIAVKPGKPTVFGTSGDRWVFGLPGNPVASLVIFETLVKPFLYALGGHTYASRRIPVRLAKTMTRKSTDRMEFVPVMFDTAGAVTPVPYHGSAHLYAYTRAQGMVVFPRGCGQLDEGCCIEVTLL